MMLWRCLLNVLQENETQDNGSDKKKYYAPVVVAVGLPVGISLRYIVVIVQQNFIHVKFVSIHSLSAFNTLSVCVLSGLMIIYARLGLLPPNSIFYIEPQ